MATTAYVFISAACDQSPLAGIARDVGIIAFHAGRAVGIQIPSEYMAPYRRLEAWKRSRIQACMTSLGWHRPAAVIRLRAAAALRGERILGFLVLAYVALLPFQLPINNEINFAPADVFLLLILPLAAASLKYCKLAWSAWHSALPLVFIISTFF